MCIFSNVPTSVMVFSDTAELIDANERCFDYHGTTNVQDMKSNLEKEDTWDILSTGVKAAIGGVSTLVEYSFVCPDNGRKWVKAVASPILSKEGDLLGVSVMEKDVTLKRRMLTSLQQMNIA